VDTGQRTQRKGHMAVAGWLVLAVTAVGGAGCGSVFRPPSEWFGSGATGPNEQSGALRVESRPGGQPAELGADDVVRVMRRVGFGDDHIRNLGPSLYNALRFSGAAVVLRGKQPLVMCAANAEYLFVQAQGQGSFVYDIKDKCFGMVPPMPMEWASPSDTRRGRTAGRSKLSPIDNRLSAPQAPGGGCFFY
jgi:hypothetical protein